MSPTTAPRAQTWVDLVLVVAALGLLAFMFTGCAGMTTQQKTQAGIAVAGDVLQCAVNDASIVERVIRDGGNAQIGDWLSAAIGVFQCIPQVVRHIQEQQAQALLLEPTAYMIASADDEDAPAPPPTKVLSKRALRRLAALKVLGDVLNRNVVAQ